LFCHRKASKSEINELRRHRKNENLNK